MSSRTVVFSDFTNDQCKYAEHIFILIIWSFSRKLLTSAAEAIITFSVALFRTIV